MAGQRGGRIDRSGGGNFLHELISRRNRLYTTLTFNLLNASWPRRPRTVFIYRSSLSTLPLPSLSLSLLSLLLLP